VNKTRSASATSSLLFIKQQRSERVRAQPSARAKEELVSSSGLFLSCHILLEWSLRVASSSMLLSLALVKTFWKKLCHWIKARLFLA
jgi:hypothetical protein